MPILKNFCEWLLLSFEVLKVIVFEVLKFEVFVAKHLNKLHKVLKLFWIIPSLKRKHEDLQRTAKAPGQTKLSFVQPIPKEPEVVSIMGRLIKLLKFFWMKMLKESFTFSEFVTYGVNNLH